jgi:long-subunit acyl-CoA synthetase (AMP-forming)
MKLLEQLVQHASRQPEAPAILGADLVLSYGDLQTELDRLTRELGELQVSILALDLDNGPAWALLDLAALACGITLIPLPPFFSPRQLQHTLAEAGVEMVISDNPQRLKSSVQDMSLNEGGWIQVCEEKLECIVTELTPSRLPADIAKITFTSGTTAEPKGVMLTWKQMQRVVESLADAVGVVPTDRHVALTPLAVLLENIAGLYVPLWAGASVALPPLSETGLQGAAGLDPRLMLHALISNQATTAIFSPQMLQGAVACLQAGCPLPKGLRFIAVGGASVSRRLLQKAAELELPVYEGYGLSEHASVVCLNRPGYHCPGSVGKPLPHVELKIAEDGEVLIKGNPFSGYLGETDFEAASGWWRSGDIGHLDDQGFLHLLGRRRHIFITAYGRNVSPEWVERELVLEPAIAQAVVFGEARPWNCALILAAADADKTAVEVALQRVNTMLPDYARITQWLPADAPFSPHNGQLSGTGRLRREAIYQHYAGRIDALYTEVLVS